MKLIKIISEIKRLPFTTTSKFRITKHGMDLLKEYRNSEGETFFETYGKICFNSTWFLGITLLDIADISPTLTRFSNYPTLQISYDDLDISYKQCKSDEILNNNDPTLIAMIAWMLDNKVIEVV